MLILNMTMVLENYGPKTPKLDICGTKFGFFDLHTFFYFNKFRGTGFKYNIFCETPSSKYPKNMQF